MRLAAVTGCNLNYSVGAAAVLRGIRSFHPNVDRYCFVPIEEVDEAKNVFGDLATVLPPPRHLVGIPGTGDIQAYFARFFLPTVPADIAACFDCDMIIRRPINEIWDVEPGRIRAVRDHAWNILFLLPEEHRIAFAKAFPKHTKSHGFNAGMFSMRTSEWVDLPERLEAGLALCGFENSTRLFDQPFLNELFLYSVYFLRIEYNAHYIYDYRIPRNTRIVHFTGTPKPWKANYPKHEPAYYYWLRYGVREERFWPLAKSKLRIWARTPRRLISRYLKARGIR